MKITCDIVIDYADKKKAMTICKAIEVDDFDFVTSKIYQGSLHAHLESTSISSLLHTLDDYLSCVSIAEKVVDKS